MELRELSTEELTDIYNKYMTTDFPPDELKPLERILYTKETGLCCTYGIFEQGNLRGYAIFIVPQGVRYGLLDYLAVLPDYRGMGVGHEFFRLISDTLVIKYPYLSGFFIESENIEFAANGAERRIREKRIDFYRQNHCLMTPFCSELFGVTYSILTYNFDKKSDRTPALEDLDAIYIAMFKKHHYENNVRLWQYGN